MRVPRRPCQHRAGDAEIIVLSRKRARLPHCWATKDAAVPRNSFHFGIFIASLGVMNTHAGRIQSMPEGRTRANLCSSKERIADAVILKLKSEGFSFREISNHLAKISGIGNWSILSTKGRSPSFADYARRGTKKRIENCAARPGKKRDQWLQFKQRSNLEGVLSSLLRLEGRVPQALHLR
jgi:hypothetical protein